jgi:NADPH2:quinone reductase
LTVLSTLYKAIVREGVVKAFNHRDAEYVSKIKDNFPGGFDICIEMLASTNFNVDLTILAKNGRLVIVGSRGEVNVNPRLIMTRELEVHGVSLTLSGSEDILEMGAFISAGLASGILRPVIGLTLPLGRAAEAHEEVISRGKVNVGNIILIPNEVLEAEAMIVTPPDDQKDEIKKT